MIDILIPLGNGSKWNNNELRYSLRSIEKHVKGLRNVIISTTHEFPEFINQYCDSLVKFMIYEPEDPNNKQKNICRKIEITTMGWHDLSSTFLFTNDDIFFNKDVDITKYPHYYSGVLEYQLMERRKNRLTRFGSENEAIANTIHVLREHLYETRNYDIHVPIRYEKEAFVKAMGKYDWNAEYGYVIKSLYCNTVLRKNKKIGKSREDCKIDWKLSCKDWLTFLKDKDVFSIGDKAIDSEFEKAMETLYPNKSRWEI